MNNSDILNQKAKLNLKLLMCIKILTSTWFWLGIWVLYYLKFTDYTGIGIIETIGFTIAILAEIPAGMLSDKVGHRTNLILFTGLSLWLALVYMPQPLVLYG